jgi:hypothetical protein
MSRLQFLGHETFVCKQFWLKKGFDFLKSGKSFNSETAVVDLGVGKNMVSSIRFWLKAYGLTDDNDQIQELANYLLSDLGKDPFMEDLGTLWLLHYQLVKTNKASIYNFAFNQLRKQRIEFTKEQFHSEVNKFIKEAKTTSSSEKTIDTDISVFLRNYNNPDISSSKLNIEDEFSNLLTDLDLITTTKRRNLEGKTLEYHEFRVDSKKDLPWQIVLYSILNNEEYGNSISLKQLEIGHNSPGAVFALSLEGLYSKLEEIVNYYPQVTFTQTAGNQVLQFREKPNKWEVLNDYYKL